MSFADQNMRAPIELYGPLLAAVQESGIFGDGKAFVDAVALRPVADIMADFDRLEYDDAKLLHFVKVNFQLPPETASALKMKPSLSLRAYIRDTWQTLARNPNPDDSNSSALPIAHRHIVPGGRFREMYYWDNFFTLLGLVRDDEMELANDVVDAMTDLIEQFGYVPNGTRTYYLSRSQPPLYYMMVQLLAGPGNEIPARRLHAMKREHAWWMNDSDELPPGSRSKHVARLADGNLVNRYWDPRRAPRDESWHEDIVTASNGTRAPDDIYQDLRAGAESGWDFSSRWLDGNELSSIRTSSIAPIDLNSFLYGLESAIAGAGSDEDAKIYGELARQRGEAIQLHFWNESDGYFTDLDLDLGLPRTNSCAAAVTPLLVGLATQEQAESTAEYFKKHYLAPGGCRTTLVSNSQQWDQPNGWAPLQWIAVTGLRRYGHEALAREIARRWTLTVEKIFKLDGLIYEKYDIEACSCGSGGEYAVQTGFGWTNGVTADFIDHYGF